MTVSLLRPAVCLAAAVLFALPASAGVQQGPCPEPPGSPLEIGETLRLGEWAYQARLEAHLPEKADAWNTLEVRLDLVVRTYDPATRELGPNTQPLAVTGHWAWTDGIADPLTGQLAERVSGGGTALGFDVSVERPILADYVATFEVDPGDGAACGSVVLRFAVPSALIEASVMPSGQNSAIRAPGDNHHMNLLSQIDIYPSQSKSDIWGYDDGSTYLAIMGTFNGTVFMDVTDPYNPVEVGFVPGPGSSWRDIKTYQNYAYAITEGSGAGEGLQIIDLSDPFNPTLVNTYAVNFTTTHNIWIDEDRGHAWLVGTNNGTRIVDLADPVNPVEIGSWSTRYIHDIYVKDNIAYLAEIFSGLHEILDASDPANLQIMSSWSTPMNFTHNSWPNEDMSLLVTSDEVNPGGHLAVYDISDKQVTPPKLGEYTPNPSAVVHNVFFDDVPGADRAAMSHYALGVKYVDLQRPSIPVELGSYDTRASTDGGFSGCWGVYPFDPRGYIYAADIQSGLFVLEYAPTGGALTGIVRDDNTEAGIPNANVLSLSDSSLLTTNGNGEFGRYADAGALALRVSAPGYQTKVVVAGEMTLGGGLDVTVDLLPLPTATITGTVSRSSDQSPVDGAVVTVVDSGQSAISDGAGAFTIPDVAIGQRLVSVDRSGFSGDEATVLLQSGDVAAIAFELLEAALIDDMETDTGWIPVVESATTGRWLRDDPNGTGGGTINPEDDHTPPPGIKAWFTGQGIGGGGTGTNPELQDVDGGTVALLSPVIDLSALPNPTFRYHRWFSTDAGQLTGGTMRVQISDDAGSNWTTVELLSSDANSWINVAIPLNDYIGINDQFQARFACEAIPELDQQRILECGLDDVEILQECRARVVVGGLDSDFDGRLDSCDSCPFDPDDDADGDGVCGDVDNAPNDANAGQADSDGDGVGDVIDNCASTANPAQFDLDRDGQGDACDADIDGDGVANAVDADNDNDGVLDVDDVCPTVPDAVQKDFDADLQGDACDGDDGLVHGVRMDGDGISWQVESGATSYNVYRSELGAAVLIQLGDCRASGLTQSYYVDTRLPEPGSGWAYLVTAVVSGVEQGWGYESDGTPRVVNGLCP